MSEHELQPAINVLKRRLDDLEHKANETLGALNILLEEAGLPPHVPGNAIASEATATLGQIKPDTFFGKKQQTAVREFLELRRSQGSGPEKPRDIYEALVAGGYKYEAKDAETALVGLRAMLRKRTNVFARIGDGMYGLVAWYPDLKSPKNAPSSKSSGNSQSETEGDDQSQVTTQVDEASDDDSDDATVAQ